MWSLSGTWPWPTPTQTAGFTTASKKAESACDETKDSARIAIVGPHKNLSGPSAKFSIGDSQSDCSIGHHPYRGTWKDGYRAPGRLGNHAQ